MKKSEDLLRTIPDFETDFREAKQDIELHPFEISIDPENLSNSRPRRRRMTLDDDINDIVFIKKRTSVRSSGINVPIRNRI